MCDHHPGRLLAAFHRYDAAASAAIFGVGIDESDIASLDGRLFNLDLSPPSDFPLIVKVITVPEGEESHYQNLILERYRRSAPSGRYFLDAGIDSDMDLYVGPDHVLDLAQVSCALEPVHHRYRGLMSITKAGGAGVRVAIIDTGIAPGFANLSPDSRNIADPGAKHDIDDQNGHGTAVAQILRDVAPDAELLILRVSRLGHVAESDVLAALHASHSADVINISLAFSLADQCPVCRRGGAQSSRSGAFEMYLKALFQSKPEAIVVAAAGNRSAPRLDFPARFADVVAVGAVDASQTVTAYSCTGAQDEKGAPHPHLYFAPGGRPGEPVAQAGPVGAPVARHGTSFAVPYVAGMIANHIATAPAPARNRRRILDAMRQSAQSLPNHVGAQHGNGLAMEF